MLTTDNIRPDQGTGYYSLENYADRKRTQQSSQWLGLGAQNLNLRGEVQSVACDVLMRGITPDGIQIRSRLPTHDDYKIRSALDCTFSAPKSVSWLALVYGDDAVRQAHINAVINTLRYIEKHYAQTRVYINKERHTVKTGNLVMALFHHDVNRDLIFHLHTHGVIFNGTQLPSGKWYSLRNDAIHQHKKLLGQIYQRELAIALQELGYKTVPRDHGQFEIEGFSREQIMAFSSRRQKILELLPKESTWAERERVWRQTRAPKGKPEDRMTMVEYWRSISHDVGLDTADLRLNEQASLLQRPPLSEAVLNALADQNCSISLESLESKVLEQHPQASLEMIQQQIASIPTLILSDQGIDVGGRFNTSEKKPYSHHQLKRFSDLSDMPAAVGYLQQAQRLKSCSHSTDRYHQSIDDYCNLSENEKDRTIIFCADEAIRHELVLQLRQKQQPEASDIRLHHHLTDTSQSISVGEGDHLVWTKGSRINGHRRGEIFAIATLNDGEAVIQYPNGSLEVLDLNQPQPIDHAVVRSQLPKHRCKRIHIVGDSTLTASDLEQAINVSRSEVCLYCDDIQALQTQMLQSPIQASPLVKLRQRIQHQVAKESLVGRALTHIDKDIRRNHDSINFSRDRNTTSTNDSRFGGANGEIRASTESFSDRFGEIAWRLSREINRANEQRGLQRADGPVKSFNRLLGNLERTTARARDYRSAAFGLHGAVTEKLNQLRLGRLGQGIKKHRELKTVNISSLSQSIQKLSHQIQSLSTGEIAKTSIALNQKVTEKLNQLRFTHLGQNIRRHQELKTIKAIQFPQQLQVICHQIQSLPSGETVQASIKLNQKLDQYCDRLQIAQAIRFLLHDLDIGEYQQDGSLSFQSQKLKYCQKGDVVTVSAKDSRGDLLKVSKGRVSLDRLNNEDLQICHLLQRKLAQVTQNQAKKHFEDISNTTKNRSRGPRL